MVVWYGYGVIVIYNPSCHITGQITVIACVLELCWNFEPFVLARTTTYRYEAKTHSRHVIGAHVGPKTRGKYWDLRWFKKVLVVTL